MKIIPLFMLLASAACQDKSAAPPPTEKAAPSTLPAAQAVTPETPVGTPMQMQLNSTPSGATAFVNGVEVGVTPMIYTVHVTDQPIEFTFKLADYQPATYSFVPKTSGEVHGRLTATPASAANPTAPQPSPDAAPLPVW